MASEECPCAVEWEGKSDLTCARCCERIRGKIVAVFTYILRGAIFQLSRMEIFILKLISGEENENSI